LTDAGLAAELNVGVLFKVEKSSSFPSLIYKCTVKRAASNMSTNETPSTEDFMIYTATGAHFLE
jgi:hypothetical protein